MIANNMNTNESNNMTKRERIILFILLFQSICILLITIFCVWVTAYGYPLVVDGGAERLKHNLMGEVKQFVSAEIKSLTGDLTQEFSKNIDMMSVFLIKSTEGYLQQYEPLTTINVEELNQAIKKVNRLPF